MLTSVTEKERTISDPMELKRCSRCVMPETQEVISFNNEGVCATCQNIEFKQQNVDWDKKKKDFEELLDQYRGQHEYDCI
ncbi:hypothetical protein KKG16_02350, partial [Patescibacteria group bacterium]|nr:hypothetical protein [Patescibacteria group bacterium]